MAIQVKRFTKQEVERMQAEALESTIRKLQAIREVLDNKEMPDAIKLSMIDITVGRFGVARITIPEEADSATP